MRVASFAIGFVLLGELLAYSPAPAQCINYEEYLHWVGGAPTAGPGQTVTLSGNHLYVGETAGVLGAWSGLQIFNVTDPANPRIEGSVNTPGDVSGIALSETYAYVTEGRPVSPSPMSRQVGFQIIDITNTQNARILSSLLTPGSGHGVAVSGTYAYITVTDDFSGRSEFEVIDVANPRSPHLVGRVSMPEPLYGVAISGDYAYVAGCQSGLVILQISDPRNPRIVGSAECPALLYAMGVAVTNHYAYVACVGVFEGGLWVIDVADPAHPEIVGSVTTETGAGAVAISGKRAYLTDHSLEIIDITDPRSPRIIGRAGTLDGATAVAVSDNYAFLSDYDGGFAVVDISSPESAPIIGHATTPSLAQDVVVSGTHAYLTDWALEIVDIEDPHNPRLVSSLSMGGSSWAERVDVSGPYAYVGVGPCGGVGRAGLVVVDVRDPARPRIVGQVVLPPAYAIDYVSISGAYAYVGDYNYGLQVVDISSPTQPRVVGSFAERHFCGIALSGPYAYGADCGGGYDGLDVLDVSVHEHPRLVGSVSTPGPAIDVAVEGNWAYVITVCDGLSVVDISDPENPIVVGTFDNGTCLAASRIDVKDGFAYITARGLGLLVLDVRDPLTPRVAGTLSLPEAPAGITIVGELAYMADGYSGLQIAPTQCGMRSKTEPSAGPEPAISFGLNVLPDPSHGPVSIRLTLPYDARVLASVYDASGRRVRSFSDITMKAGVHDLPWDGLDDAGRQVSPGVYLARVSTMGGAKTARVVILK